MSAVVASPAASLDSLTILDVLLILIVLYSAARGFFEGLISEMGLLLALVVGTFVASQFAAQIGAPLALLGLSAPLRAAGGYLLILAIVWIGTRMLTGLLRGGAKVLMLGWVDHLAGAAFGLLRGLLIVVIVGFVIVHFRLGSLRTVAHDSYLVNMVGPIFPALNGLLPLHLQTGPTVP